MVSGSKPYGSKNNTNKRISTTTNDHRGTSGVRVTMSKEAALRLKEASGIYSEAIHTSEARRGSKAVMGKKTPILQYLRRRRSGGCGEAPERPRRIWGTNISHNIKGNRRRYRKKISRMALERWGRVAIL
jgi:hypothetical protein